MLQYTNKSTVACTFILTTNCSLFISIPHEAILLHPCSHYSSLCGIHFSPTGPFLSSSKNNEVARTTERILLEWLRQNHLEQSQSGGLQKSLRRGDSICLSVLWLWTAEPCMLPARSHPTPGGAVTLWNLLLPWNGGWWVDISVSSWNSPEHSPLTCLLLAAHYPSECKWRDPMRGRYLSSYIDSFSDLTVEECRAECMDTRYYYCISFDFYQSGSSTSCYLSMYNRYTNLLYYSDSYAYHELDCYGELTVMKPLLSGHSGDLWGMWPPSDMMSLDLVRNINEVLLHSICH